MLRRRPALVSIFISVALAGLSASAPLQAREKFESKGKNTVTPAEANFQTAMQKYKQEDLDGAIDAFLQAIYFSRNYYNPDAYYWLGMCYMAKHQDAKAIDAFKHDCQQAIGPVPLAHLHLAQLYLRNDRIDESEEEAYACLRECRGQNPEASDVLGQIKEKRGQQNEAQFQYEQALGDPPWHYTDAWMHLAELYMKEKEWAGALRQFNDMLHSKLGLKGLDYQKVLFNMGLCVLAKGDHQGAIDYWHECLNYNQSYAPAHLQLGMIFDVEQHFSSAIKEYREFVRYSKDEPAVARVKNRISVLEQKVGPQELPPEAPKPSPYMREQEVEKEKQETKEKESLSTPSTSKESGF